MGLTRRSTRPFRDGDDDDDDDEFRGQRNNYKTLQERNRAAFVAPLTILLVVLALGRIVWKPGGDFSSRIPTMPANAVRLENQVGLSLDLKYHNRKNVTQGPHGVSIIIAKSEPCLDPRFVLRLVGDEALWSIPVLQVDKYRWKGSFTIPIPGYYQLEPRWYGCSSSSPTADNTFQGEVMKLAVSGKRQISNNAKSKAKITSKTSTVPRWTPTHTSLPDLIPEGYWASPKLYGDMANQRFWVSREMGLEQPNFIVSTVGPGGRSESTVAKEATPIPREFGDLSNYELLCFVGSNSAQSIWESFLSLRPSIAKHQKPFKFHYYPVNDFRHPDREWDEELRLRFRKCKNVIVSVDELHSSSSISSPPPAALADTSDETNKNNNNNDNRISQSEYRDQVILFLRHLEQIFPDETFPIWMLTVNVPPAMNTHMCTAPYYLKRTHHHACNDVLMDIFSSPDRRRRANDNGRVRLLDNTDLTDPLLDDGGNTLLLQHDAIAVIAMRIFAIAGDQVKRWRKTGQRGTKDGLQRNGKLEPNIDFPVYNFNRGV